MLERAQIKKEIIPDSRTSCREGPVLFSGCVRVWYRIVTSGGQGE